MALFFKVNYFLVLENRRERESRKAEDGWIDQWNQIECLEQTPYLWKLDG